jgi:hypothetical protein
MLRQCGVLGPGAEDAGRVAEALQRVGGHDPVNGMEAVAESVTRELTGTLLYVSGFMFY